MNSHLCITVNYLTDGHVVGNEPWLIDDESDGERRHEPSTHWMTCGERNREMCHDLILFIMLI